MRGRAARRSWRWSCSSGPWSWGWPRTLEDRLNLEHRRAVRDPDHVPAPLRGEPGWNSDGLRQTREAEEYVPEDLNLLFLGDSFTMGLGLRRPHLRAFPHLVGERLRVATGDDRIHVANFAWTSSSPLLGLRRLVHLGRDYHPDLVVLCVDMTDPYDDIKWSNLVRRRGLTTLYDRIPITIKLTRLYFPGPFRALYDVSVGRNLPAHAFFATEQPLARSRPYLEPIATSIRAIDERARALGAELVVLVLPRWFQYDARESPHDWEMRLPDRTHTVLGPHSTAIFDWFAELDRETAFPVHSLLEDFRSSEVFPTTLEADPHWNAAGHRVAAEAVVRRLEPLVRERLRSPP